MNLIDRQLQGFGPISLDQLNHTAPLMVRRDNKYLINQQQVAHLLAAIETGFDVLKIDGKTRFAYHSSYFDSPDLHCFRDHNQDRRKRLKVRFRHYLDVNQHFMELKLKGRGGETTKLRRPISADQFLHHSLPPDLLEYLHVTATDAFAKPMASHYVKTLHVDYLRSTLVSRSGAERITLDNRLCFRTDERSVELPPQLWVVEVKSQTGWSKADELLRHIGARPANLCSKYCVGLSMTASTPAVTRFTPTIKRIRALI